jgi:integrase
MRVKLKGINPVKKRLADGTWRTYWYAWKGGPPLMGEPGSPEFVASFNAAAARKVAPATGTLQSVLRGYQASDKFRSRRERTRFDYIVKIKLIEREFGDFPLSALTDRRTRGIFMAWRDRLALKSRRQADYAWQVLALVLSWGMDRGMVAANPCAKGGRLYRGNRVDKVWTAEYDAAFLRVAPARLHLPLLMALWTGQRQGDLLRLPWSAYDGARIRLQQSKTGATVSIPVGAPLKAALDATAKTCPIILTMADGKPWTETSFRQAWRKAQADAGVTGVTFNDLRGTAVTRLALVGCTEAEIASITGHSLRDVRSILDSHYLHRDPALADNAIAKLERNALATKSPNCAPNCAKIASAK